MAKTMFGPTRHQYLGDMVSIRNPDAAKGSVRELEREFKGAATQDKRLRVARATQLAANRAAASSKRKNLSAREHQEFREIAAMYARAAKKMFAAYRR